MRALSEHLDSVEAEVAADGALTVAEVVVAEEVEAEEEARTSVIRTVVPRARASKGAARSMHLQHLNTSLLDMANRHILNSSNSLHSACLRLSLHTSSMRPNSKHSFLKAQPRDSFLSSSPSNNPSLSRILSNLSLPVRTSIRSSWLHCNNSNPSNNTSNPSSNPSSSSNFSSLNSNITYRNSPSSINSPNRASKLLLKDNKFLQ